MRSSVLLTRSPGASKAVAAKRRQPSAITRLLERAASWLEVRRQRHQLLTLNDAMLHDIGISRADAEGEAGRPFWDLPGPWR